MVDDVEPKSHEREKGSITQQKIKAKDSANCCSP